MVCELEFCSVGRHGRRCVCVCGCAHVCVSARACVCVCDDMPASKGSLRYHQVVSTPHPPKFSKNVCPCLQLTHASLLGCQVSFPVQQLCSALLGLQFACLVHAYWGPQLSPLTRPPLVVFWLLLSSSSTATPCQWLTNGEPSAGSDPVDTGNRW